MSERGATAKRCCPRGTLFQLLPAFNENVVLNEAYRNLFMPGSPFSAITAVTEACTRLFPQGSRRAPLLRDSAESIRVALSLARVGGRPKEPAK